MMKRAFVSFIITFFTFLCFSQEILSSVNSSWSTVIPGQVISEPALTSYGFCVITDAQEISTFTTKGTTLWEKPLPRSRGAFASTLDDDFFAVVTYEGKKLTLLNPSGCEIWSKELNYKILDKPFSGRDGRFFVRGEQTIQCYGINGICKWSLDTAQLSPLPILELNDGSLVAFLQEKENQKTKGLRLSPFGEILEEIIFVGEIQRAFSCNQGILLNFADGTAGLFTVLNGEAQNSWVLALNIKDSKQNLNSTFVVSQDKETVLFLLPYQNKVEVYEINQKDGQISQSFIIPEINGFKLTKAWLNNSGLLLCDNTSARFYNTENVELWNVGLPSKGSRDDFNYFFYTEDNHFVLCGLNWSLNGYTVSQSSQKKNKNKQNNRNYSNFITPSTDSITLKFTGKLDQDFISTQRTNALIAGNYGPKEIPWTNQMLGNCQELLSYFNSFDFGIHPEQSVFKSDSAGVNKMLRQLPLYGTVETINYTALFLKKVNDKSYIQTILTSIAQNGYDPDRKLLDSLEIVSTKLTDKDERLIISTCDAVFSICLFMGRPAFNSKGKDILANFITKNCSPKAKNHVRNTLKKIADLGL